MNNAAPVNVISQTYCCSTYAWGFDQVTSNGDGYGLKITMNNGAKAVGFDVFTVKGGDLTGQTNYRKHSHHFPPRNKNNP